MKRFLFFLFAFFFCFKSQYADSTFPASGDFIITVGYNATVTMETVSIPFEGTTNPDSLYYLQYNQRNIVQNGTIWKFYTTQSSYEQHQIAYITRSDSGGNIFDMGHVNGSEYPEGSLTGAWGFAKYKITITVYHGSPPKKFKFYFNSLDSRYGQDSTSFCAKYATDWHFNYRADSSFIECYFDRSSCGGNVYYGKVFMNDTLSNGEPSKEFKVWELMYGLSNPTRKDFFIRTTPIGILPDVQYEFGLRNFVIGTTVTLDTVYKYKGAQDRYGYNTIDSGNNVNFPYYYTNPPIQSGMNDPGNTFCTPGYLTVDTSANIYYGIKITAESGDKLILKRNKKLWIIGRFDPQTQSWKGDTIHFKPGSTLELEPSAEIFPYNGGVLIEEQNSITWAEHTCHAAFANSQIVYKGNNTVNNGGFVVVLNGGKLVLTDNTTLTFDGNASPLILLPGSQVILGNNSKIEFKNGAHLRADSSTFTCPTGTWQGITFENSTYDTITYCTFSGASTYLDWEQDNSSNNYIKKIVGNTFNNGKVRLAEVSRVHIQDNKFTGNTSYTGNLLEIDNSITFSPTPTYVMNIITNEFKSGAIQLKLDCYNSQRTPFFVYGNHFYGLSGTTRVGLYAYNLSGSFKSNTFEDSYYGVTAHLKNTNLNFLANTFRSSSNDNIELTLGSVGGLEPSITAGISPTLSWVGGRNSIHQNNTSTSETNSNVYFEQGSTLLTDKGQNCYHRYNDTSNYHIIGFYDCEDGPSSTLDATENYWNTTPPRFSLDCGVTLDYGNPYGSNCAATTPGGSYNVTDMGSGIYDTLFYESYSEGGDGGGKPGAGALSSISEAGGLYASMMSNSRLKNYSEAIDNAKDIIDAYGSSKYILPALDGLYMAYHLSDTSEANTNSHFTALKSYLEDKMEQYDTNLAITDKAYSYYIMCLVKMKQYSAAISAYENIMNNHPNPEAQLAASWDRASVVLMMNGQGGSYSSAKPKNKPNDRTPDRIARKTYKNASKYAEMNGSSKNEKYSKEDKELISQRVTKFNPSTNREFKEKVSADIAMLLGLGNRADNNSGNIPSRYSLHQNYPNPFNPVTTIKYDLPQSAYYSLKIYDILGREVMNVNEFRPAGTYEVKFDGSAYASGIYFYSIEAKGFKDTKKMVLIK